MPVFNHAYSIAFEVLSSHPEGEDVTADMLRAALLRRVANLNANEWLEACGTPYDTHEE